MPRYFNYPLYCFTLFVRLGIIIYFSNNFLHLSLSLHFKYLCISISLDMRHVPLSAPPSLHNSHFPNCTMNHIPVSPPHCTTKNIQFCTPPPNCPSQCLILQNTTITHYVSFSMHFSRPLSVCHCTKLYLPHSSCTTTHPPAYHQNVSQSNL